jgi:hypothetical protein
VIDVDVAPASLWRKINSRYNLVGNTCKNCNTSYFPPRIVCKNCGRKSKLVERQFSGNGTIYSFTRIRVPPDDFKDDAPYTVGLIKLDEGPMVEGHIIDNCAEVKIGGKVKMVFRRMQTEGREDLIHYQYKFEPL